MSSESREKRARIDGEEEDSSASASTEHHFEDGIGEGDIGRPRRTPAKSFKGKETWIEITTTALPASPANPSRKRRAKGLEIMKDINSLEELENTQEFLKVESRLCPKKSRTDVIPLLSVSGQQVSDWVGPPEYMSLVGLSDNLRLSHTTAQMKDTARIHKMIRQAKPVDKSSIPCSHSYFTKLQPADVRGLANSIKQMSVITIPSSLTVPVPGENASEKTTNINRAVDMLDDVMRAMKTTDFNKATHDGMSIIEASWEVMKTVLLNSDR